MNANLSKNDIDELVIGQVDNQDAWGAPITVNKKLAVPFRLTMPFEIVSDKDILGGTPVFRGTNVPVSALIDNLENGVSVDDFIRNFPIVKREQAIKVLEFFRNSLTRLKTA